MTFPDRLLLGSAAFFCVLGIGQATIDLAALLGHSLPMGAFLETRYILAAIPGLVLTVAKDPGAVLNAILPEGTNADSH